MIVVNLDVVLAQRKVSSKTLASAIGITEANLSLLKRGKVKGVRFETLAAICAYLNCQPGEILAYNPDNPSKDNGGDTRPRTGEDD